MWWSWINKRTAWHHLCYCVSQNTNAACQSGAEASTVLTCFPVSVLSLTLFFAFVLFQHSAAHYIPCQHQSIPANTQMT